MSKPVQRRMMTPDEMQAIERMHGVAYPVASWDKRFMRRLSSCETISDKEAAQLWRVFIRYRRQMSFPGQAELLRMAEGLAAPDLRKVEAARKAQAQIDELKAKYQQSFK
jgi:hypothetical protein